MASTSGEDRWGRGEGEGPSADPEKLAKPGCITAVYPLKIYAVLVVQLTPGHPRILRAGLQSGV